MKQSEISTILNNLINKKIDYDGVYGHQCVDLVYYVLREVYGMKNWLNLRNGAAKDMAHPEAYREFASQLEFINNTPEFVPQVGDICVTLGGQYNGFYGHVFMVMAGSTTSQMRTLEQNTGNGDGKGEDDRTLARWRNYDNILTFVRWKGIKANETIISNNNQDMELKNQMKNIIMNDTRYDEESRRMLLAAVDNNDMGYVLAFSGAFNSSLIKAQQYKKGELELAYNNLLGQTPAPTLDSFVAQQLPEVPTVSAPTVNEDEVEELIKETAKRFNLNDWAMGWLTFGIDKWSIISALIASGAYYMQNNVDPQYHALIAYTAVGWSTLILVFFLYNKAKK